MNEYFIKRNHLFSYTPEELKFILKTYEKYGKLNQEIIQTINFVMKMKGAKLIDKKDERTE